MANYSTLLKDWGSTGSEFPTGYNYEEDEQPVDAWDNFLINQLISDVKDQLIPLTNKRIESEKGTTLPTSQESAHLFAETDTGLYYVYDSSTSNWRPLMFADGDSMRGVLDMNGYKIEDTSGNLTLAGDVEASRVYYTATGNWFNGGHGSLAGVQSDQHHTRPSAGTLMSEDSNQNFNVQESQISHDGIDQSTVDSDDHHTRPSAGDGMEEDSNNNFNIVDGPGSGVDADTVDGDEAADLVHEAGDTMSGNLDMGSNSLNNVSSINASANYGNTTTYHKSDSGYTNTQVSDWTNLASYNPSGDVLFHSASWEEASSNADTRVWLTFKDGTSAEAKFANCHNKIIDKIEFQYNTIGTFELNYDFTFNGYQLA